MKFQPCGSKPLLIVFLACLTGGTPASAATCYTGDGVLTSQLELQRWMINRARFAPEREADRLGLTNTFINGHPDYDVCEDVDTNAFGGTTNEWTAWVLPRPPLAPNARLSTASTKHCRDLAETGTFQHTSPSSNYYPLGSAPDERALQEGYTNQISGYYENIGERWASSSIAYPAEAYQPGKFHDDLFIDAPITNRGHRQAILNVAGREIGLGFFRTNYVNGDYNTLDYYTQDFGADWTNHFFTDTMFNDANTNGVYNEGDGVGGIEVRLWDGTNEAAWYDVSEASGNFAVPITLLADGHTIRVELTNTNSTSRQITLPLGYTTLAGVTLTNQETYIAGYYTQPVGVTNIGFRDLFVPTQCASLSLTGTVATVSFSSLASLNYRLESSTNLLTTNWISVATGTAIGRFCQLTAPAATNSPLFYRVILLRD